MKQSFLLSSVFLVVVLLCAPGFAQQTAQRAGPIPPRQPARPALPAGIASDWWSQVQANIQKEEYSITWKDETALPDMKGAYQAPNRAQGFRTYFAEDGIRVVPRTEGEPSWNWGLALVEQAAGDRRQAAEGARQRPRVRTEENRIEFDRGWITEWYVNSPEGLEQGFTIPNPLPVASSSKLEAGDVAQAPPPADNGAQPRAAMLHIDLMLTGNLHPKFSEDGQAVDFYKDGNFNVLHYSKLIVKDAAGQVLPARFEGWAGSPNSELRTPNCGGGVRIVVDAADASYPITVDPLATTPAWSAESDQADANFGWSVATAGDVNGDGYSDVIVGSYAYDNGQADEGRAYVYHGSASGLGAAASWTAESGQAAALFGVSVATAGDVNGDGYFDVIVGAYYYDNGESDEGRAYVYHGSASGLAAAAAWTAESDRTNANFGGSVGTAGDVNGDGYSDVIVGASYYENDQVAEGRAFVYHGSASGLGAAAVWTAEGNQASTEFGCAVATAGDVNGDGYSDVIVGARFFDNLESNEGRAFVYHGSASGLNSAASWSAESDQASAQFGNAVATAGDVNGDGYSDVIVGAWLFDNVESNEGRAFVYHGSASGLGAAAAWRAESDQASSYFGNSVGTAGDVNGDGYSDIIVGAPSYDNGQSNEGRGFVYHGSASGLSAAAVWTAEGNQANASFGQSVAAAGDVNGDGYSDVIVGADGYTNGQSYEGRAFVYHGSASGLGAAAGWTAEGNQAGELFGISVAAAGDVDGDGYSDVIVGAQGYDNGGIGVGRAFVYHGSVSGPSATPDWMAEGDQAYAYFGCSVGTAGDVNGDGYSDVIVGAFSYDNGQTDEGRAFVYQGSLSGLSPTAAWTAESDKSGSSFGVSVATAGDVNGDGYSDVIVGADAYDNDQANEGRAFVYHGSTSGLSTTANWTAESDKSGSSFGIAVATAGDVNGDGYSDVIVGSSGYSNGQSFEGRAFVYHGSASGLSATAAWTAESDQVSAYLGNSVATAGDVNGDGYSDVIVGDDLYDNGQSNEGRAFVYQGSASGLSSTPNWTAEGDQVDAYFGCSVATAGDVNGDGYADVIIGASSYDNDHVNEGRAFMYLGSASGLSTPAAWTAESDQATSQFGVSVAAAGDVNGDGYTDVIVGAYWYDNGQTDEGRAFVYYGNGGPGLSLTPQQRRSDDTAPIGHLGKSDAGQMFEAALMGRTPYGRGKFKMEWEVKTLGTLFDGTGTGLTTDWQDTGVAGLLQKEIVDGLTKATVYHWRVRLLYHPATTPFQQAGRWLTLPWNGWQEADLRTAYEADLGVVQVDSPDPLLFGGGNVTYTVTISNAGPDPASATLTDTLPSGTAFVSATPSQGSCIESSGVVTCEMGMMASSGSATVSVVVTPPSAGTYTNHATVSSANSGDYNLGNNTADETTTVNAPAIGNFVWEDTDGDGIQDAGEPGMPGIVVQLYDSTYAWLAQKVTDPSGLYKFSGLTYGSGYFVKVIPPSGDYSFSQPNQGSDDTLDSDVDITTGQTPIFNLVNGLDPSRWDAGLVYQISCEPPDEPVYLYNVVLDINGNPLLNIWDPNQPTQATGYNVYRSDDPVPPPSTWPVLGSNVVDMDEGSPNVQWVDATGDDPGPPYYTWFYQITAYNAYCPAEGPF